MACAVDRYILMKVSWIYGISSTLSFLTDNLVRSRRNRRTAVKKIYLFLFMCLVAASCGLEPNPEKNDDDTNRQEGLGNSVRGNVQKGPFALGSVIVVVALDDALNPTEKICRTVVTDNSGSFEISNQIDGRYVEIVATGRYFNEMTGRESDSRIILRALADLTEDGNTNVNLLTTLAAGRIRHLVQSGNMDMTNARRTAEKELLDLFHIPETVQMPGSFDKLDILRGGDANAVLLAISATMQGGRSESELSELLSKAAAEFEASGKVGDSVMAMLREGGMSVDAASVRNNLESFCESSGMTGYEIPPFEDFIDANGNGVIDRQDSWLVISPKEVFLSDEAGSFEVALQHNLTYDVMIESDVEGWISQDLTKAHLETDVLKFSCTANEGYDARYARIVVKDRNSDLTDYIRVVQKQHDALSVTSDYVSLPREGGNFQIEVKSNMDVSVEIPANMATWITPVPATKGLVSYVLEFSASRNDEPDSRMGKIVLRSGELYEEVTVCQQGERVLLLDRNDFTLSCERQNVVVRLTSNLVCNVVMPAADWIRRTAMTRSLVTSDLVFEVDANEGYDSREARILVQAGGMQESIRIAQLQKDAIIVGTDRYEVSYEGGVVDVALSSNVKYEVSVADGVDWIECLPVTKALTESVVSLNVARNDGLLERVGAVTISNAVSGLSNTVTVVQGGNVATFEVDIPTAGTLSGILTDVQKTNIVNMKVTGNLNGDDFKTMEAMPKLTELDLSGAAVQGNIIPEEAMTNTNDKEFRYGSKSNLHRIVLPEGVISIGKGAFCIPSLEDIVLPESLSSIREYAFYNSGLVDILIPANVVFIERNAFCRASKLESVRFAPDSKLQRIEGSVGRSPLFRELAFSGAFMNCSSLKRFELPSSVSYIGVGAFYGCSSLEDFIIPDNTSLTSIEGYYARNSDPLAGGDYYGGIWENCISLNEIRIPAKIKSIDKYAFRNSGVRKIVFAGESQCEKIGNHVFSGCKTLESIDIPATVKTIGDYVFQNCASLKSLDLSNAETVGVQLVSGCSSLKEISLPDSMTEIGDKMFWGCSALENLNMPAGVTRIGKYAFYKCSSLKTVPESESLKTIGDYAFSGCSSLSNVVIPKNVYNIGNSAFYECENMTGFHLSHQDSIVLGGRMFGECGKLSEIDLCARKIVPRSGLFSGANIYEYEIPEEVEFWGVPHYCSEWERYSTKYSSDIPDYDYDRTFSGNYGDGGPFTGSKITSITFAPNSRLKECGARAFAGAEYLSSLTLPSSVETIGMEMFKGDKILMEFSIPSHVKKITGPVYGGSYILSPKVEDPSKLEYVGNYGLMGITNEQLDLSNCAYLGQSALACCENLKSVTFKQDGVLQMGSTVFAQTPNIKEFVIPRGLKELRTTRSKTYGSSVEKYSSTPFKESSIVSVRSEDNACLEYVDVALMSETLASVDLSGITSASFSFARLDSRGDDGKYYAFCSCPALQTLLLPHADELSFDYYPFLQCDNLKKLVMPSSLKKLNLSKYAIFYGSSITDFVSEKGGEGFELAGTFQKAASLKNIDIDVLNVPDNCFWNCPALENLDLPKVKTIGKNIFVEKRSDVPPALKSLNLPVVETIGEWAFSNQTALEELNLPEVISVGQYAFCNCTALRSFDAPKLREVGKISSKHSYSYVFSGCTSLEQVSLGSVTELGDNCFYNCASLKQAIFPSVEKMGDDVFCGCASLERVEFSSSLKKIGKECFMNCSALKSISIPNCTSVGISAFSGCSHLSDVEANAMKYIGAYAFSHCVELRGISLSEVKSIGEYAFEGCCKLAEISILKCTSLGKGAFAGCIGMSQEVLTLGTVYEIGDNCFSDFPKLTILDLTKGLSTRSSQCFPPSVKVVINRDNWPVDCPLNAFSLMNLPECTLYVPAAVIERYKSKNGWTDFGTILPIE